MLNANLIRTQVILVAEPGLLVEAAIRAIVAEAERYGKEKAEDATKGTLFEVKTSPGCPPDVALMLDQKGKIAGLIRGIRSDLELARRKQWKPR